jgi:pilus assembly protein Flp/PilA
MFEIKMLVDYLRSRMSSDEGASAVEYGLIVSLIAAAIVTVVTTLGTHVGAVFTSITSKF